MSSQRLLTLVMTDLVGSTESVARLGPADGERWRQQHVAVLRGALAANGGRELQMLGDGILAAFASASAAVGFAVSAQQRIAQVNARRDALAPFGLRVGIAVGEATQDDEGVHGLVVVEAARLCAAARGGQVLASALVEALCATRQDVRFTSLGMLELKGLSAPVSVVEVRSDREHTARAIPVPATLVALESSHFVGRASERAALAAAWARAQQGERRTSLIAGEPGIGKTRLAAELARGAVASGAIVLHGRCDEDLSAPFQPWLQALRHYVAHAEPAGLRADLAESAGDLARLLPELAKFAPAGAPQPLDPESERLRLFDAVDHLLASASRAAPVLVVLDDLHWADKPSLVLLRHLVRSPRPAALLLVATYRETDLVRTHPLAEMLADLRRESSVERLLLRGLDEGETTALLAARAAHDVPAAFARALHAETSGNPFFVEEVLRHLAETGALRHEAGRWTSDRRIEELGIPESVREVVGRRLSRLSEAANQALGVAAVIGREFDVGKIEAVGGPAGDALLDALDEAVRARLIGEAAEAPGHFVFAHALVRQTLYEELSSARRARLHWRIGDELEKRFAGALDEHGSAIAHHLCEGALAGDLLRAVDAALRAARRAAELYAHEETIGQSRRALALLDHTGLEEDERRYELLMVLGEALLNIAGEFRPTFLDAVALAQRNGWGEREARAVLGATAWWELEASAVLDQRRAIDRAISALPAGDSEERCSLLSRLTFVRSVTDDPAALEPLADEAVAMARRLGVPDMIAWALGAKFFLLINTPRLREAEALSREYEKIAQGAGRARFGVLAARSFVQLSLRRGDRKGFDRDLEGIRVWLKRTRLRMGIIAGLRAADALAAGRFADARALASELRGGAATNLPFRAVVVAARLEEGRLAQVADAVEPFAASMPRWAQAYRCVAASARAALGQLDAARALFDELARDDFSALPRDWAWQLSLRHLAETCALLGSAEGARQLEPHIAAYSGQLLVAFGMAAIEGAADRALGQVLATQGRLDEALDCYARALVLEEGFGATALASRTRYWWARALLERSAPGDRDRAQTLASECVSVTSSLGMAHLESSARALFA